MMLFQGSPAFLSTSGTKGCASAPCADPGCSGTVRQDAEQPSTFPKDHQHIRMSSHTASPMGQAAVKHSLTAWRGKKLPLFPLILPVVPKSDRRRMSASTSRVGYRALCTPNTGAVLQPGPTAEHNPCTTHQHLCRAEAANTHPVHGKHQRERRQRLSAVPFPHAWQGREGL